MALNRRLARLEARLRPRVQRLDIEGIRQFMQALWKVYGPPGDLPMLDDRDMVEEYERLLDDLLEEQSCPPDHGPGKA